MTPLRLTTTEYGSIQAEFGHLVRAAEELNLRCRQFSLTALYLQLGDSWFEVTTFGPMDGFRARRHSSTGSKIASTGLAVATCIGVVGVIGVRSAQESSAAAQKAADQTSAPATVVVQEAAVVSSSGLTQADLDSYAAKLEQERVKLEKYRAKLVAAAEALQQASVGQSAATGVTKPKKLPAKLKAPKPNLPTPKPVKPAKQAKPQKNPVSVAPPVRAPQSNTKSS